MSTYCKDPQARIDYAIDWSEAIGEATVIAASLWSVAPADPGGVAVEAHGFSLRQANVTLSGGIEGRSYRVANRVTTTDGQIDERSLLIRVEQR